jgi:oligoendopeptidase F
MEDWLVAVLQKWHDITPDIAIEPWDFAYNAGRGNRALRDAISVESLRSINDRFYRDLGADPVTLQVQYDLEPRLSKDPVAFTTFGRRPRFEAGTWVLGEPWVFASYQMGGLDNLLELLHETGHAIHIAAIRTRPAFNDWPDSDIFTEGIADIATLEMYEPVWQQRYLGTSIPIEDAVAAKYAAIVMDIAWALFEVRMHRAPERDPNELWGEICQRYFRIKVYPDLAWWAVRGQLIDSPGYMMNYAAGAILNADLRARSLELYGPYSAGDSGWYDRISEALYRFGLEKTSKEVIEAFLGRPVSPQALLEDMSRATTDVQ